MQLTPMRFKDFTWPHNPAVYRVEYRRRLAVHPVPFGRCVLEELGGAYRVLSGEGVFAGPWAYQQFQRLAEVFREGGPGLLVHPVWQTERAYFASLEAAEEPLPDFVRYRFEFWEDWTGYDAALTEQTAVSGSGTPEVPASPAAVTVRRGDTLWGIARAHGVTLAALIRANPQIKNPNLIRPGEAVILP